MVNNKKEINVSFNIERKQLNLRLDTNERYIKTFKENNVDATTVQIRSSDRVYEDYFLEPELEYDNNTLVGKEIFIPQFPASQPIQNARGIISETNDYPEFAHKVKTLKGSSGSPIFLKGNNKVIGIHKEGAPLVGENYGDFIEPIINILIDEIKARTNIMQAYNNKQISDNISQNSHQSFNNASAHRGHSYFSVKVANLTNQIKPANPINQINPVYNKPVNQINQNVMNNNIVVQGNLTNFIAINLFFIFILILILYIKYF